MKHEALPMMYILIYRMPSPLNNLDTGYSCDSTHRPTSLLQEKQSTLFKSGQWNQTDISPEKIFTWQRANEKMLHITNPRKKNTTRKSQVLAKIGRNWNPCALLMGL